MSQPKLRRRFHTASVVSGHWPADLPPQRSSRHCTALPPDPNASYDSCVTYIVIHGSDEKPVQHTGETLGAATRLALAYGRENRKNVRIRLPSGATMTFEAFQEAIFQGDLRD